MKIMVTGAAGFVGRACCARLRAEGHEVVPAVRRAGSGLAGEQVTGGLGPDTDWRAALDGVGAVIHLAARVHVMDEREGSADAEFERINVQGSRTLARQALAAGVRRLVFVSSIKVNGERTHGRAFTAEDAARPEDAYGRSKLAAELALKEFAADGLELVIVRPCMVVGPDVRGNLPRLMRAIQRGLPLPLGAVRNRRSLVSVENLADLLALCATHPAAAGEIFLAAEAEVLSTPALIRTLAEGLACEARLPGVPPALLRLAGRLSGKLAQVERLCSDLEADAGKARELLGWRARESLCEALLRSARQFRSVR